MKRLLVLVLLALFVTPLFADKVLFMKPVTKNIEKEDSLKIVRDIESILKSKFSYVSYKDVKKSLLEELAKCGSKPECWYEKASDEKFQFSLLTLISMNDDEEVIIRTVLIDIENEETVDDSSKTYDDIDSVSKENLYKQIRKTSASVYNKIKAGAGGSSKKDSNYEEDEDEASSAEKAKKAEDERRRKLDEERRKRELELEKKREEEERVAKEAERKKRIEEERKRREEEREKERLEMERARREEEKRQEQESKKQSLMANGEKLSRARELVLQMCSEGKYNQAITAIVKVSELKCECEEDAKVLALKTQLLNFNKVRSKILEGVQLLDYNLILDNLEAAKALDEYIVPGGTEFSKKIYTIEAIGHMAKGKDMEKKDNYILANEAFEKCAELDPDKTECKDWLDSKDKLVKRVYDKASVMKNFNPTKAKELLRSILKLVTAENEYYKKAEADLQKMEF